MRVLGAPALARRSRSTSTSCGSSGSVEHTGRVEPRPVDARARDRGARLVHAGVRRRALAPGGEVPRPGAAADPDRLTGAHLGPDPRHARRDRERAPLRRRRRDRRDAGRRGVPPVGDERRQRLEDPAPAHGARPRHRSPASRRSPGRRSRSTTSCTPRSSSPTTSRSWARSTSRARASGTPRTCSRSTTRRSPTGWPTFVDEVRARYPRTTPPRFEG